MLCGAQVKSKQWAGVSSLSSRSAASWWLIQSVLRQRHRPWRGLPGLVEVASLEIGEHFLEPPGFNSCQNPIPNQNWEFREYFLNNG